MVHVLSQLSNFVKMTFVRICLSIGAFIKTVACYLNNYALLVTALATASLVLVTYFHIQEAKEMREATRDMASETKRLADITVEQFKIKSYPNFLIEQRPLSFESGKRIQSFILLNAGEITAFNVSFLSVNVYEKDTGELDFISLLYSIYQELERKLEGGKYTKRGEQYGKKGIGHEIKLPHDTSFAVQTASRKPDERIDKLRYNLIFIRYKVPFDDVYRYEVFGYNLKRRSSGEKPTSYEWQLMASSETTGLIKPFTKSLKNEKVKNFLADYSIMRVSAGRP